MFTSYMFTSYELTSYYVNKSVLRDNGMSI